MNAAPQHPLQASVVARIPVGWTAGRVVATTLTVALIGLVFYAAIRFQAAIFMLATAMMFRVAMTPPKSTWKLLLGLRAN